MTVQAPQVPRSQTRLQPVALRELRRGWGRGARGSTEVVILVPLTVRSSLTGPGPMATASPAAPPAPGLSSAPARTDNGDAVKAVVAAATPEPLMKSRRDRPPFFWRPWGSFMMQDSP